MNPIAFQSAPPGVRPPRPWFPFLPPDPPRSSAFWETRNVSNQLKEFRETLNLAKAMYVCTTFTSILVAEFLLLFNYKIIVTLLGSELLKSNYYLKQGERARNVNGNETK